MLTDIQIHSFADALKTSQSDPRRAACTEAFFFLDTLRALRLPQPDACETADLIAAIDAPACALISSDRIAESRGTSTLFATPEDGAIAIFPDFSFLWFDAEGKMGEQDATIAAEAAPLCLSLLEECGFQVMTTSRAMDRLQKEQDASELKAAFDYDTIVEDLLSAEYEMFDPLVDASDMSSEQNWTDEDEEKLRRALDMICLGLGITQADGVHLHITSATPEEAFKLELLEHGPTIDAAGLIEALQICLPLWITTKVFSGHDYIANGQDSERRSGWGMAALTVLSYRFDPAAVEVSNHQKINADPLLRLTLAEAGISETCTKAILAAIRPAPAS